MKKPKVLEEQACLCPLFGLLDVIGKKWSLLIIAMLGNEGEKGFNELKSELERISPKTLSGTLKKLEEINLVHKRVLPTSPPGVKYSLSSEGHVLREQLMPLLEWISKKGGKQASWCPIKVQSILSPDSKIIRAREGYRMSASRSHLG